VRPAGLVLVETNHRDALAVFLSKGMLPSQRLPDGTLVVEQPRFDPVAGVLHTSWHWSGPAGHGRKDASLRIYSVTELVRMMERAGLRIRSLHRGCSPDVYRGDASDVAGRLGVLAERPADT
jgi:hypothetical protein